MNSFNEWAVYATFYSENPTKDPNAGGALLNWIQQIEAFAPFIEAELIAQQITPNTNNRSNTLVLAFLFRNADVASRSRLAARYYKKTGLFT